MGLFSRKKEEREVPELPPLPETRSLELPPIDERPRTHEIREVKSAVSDMPRLPEPPRPVMREDMSHIREIGQERKEPIFVRIDKFESSLKNFDSIKKQIDRISEDLKELKDIKQKEEEEVEAWEHEIADIKEKLGRIDRAVFTKL